MLLLAAGLRLTALSWGVRHTPYQDETVFLPGTRIGGPRLGLIAALLLAVSPLDVETAHMVRPDVVLQAFVILAFLAFLAPLTVGGDVAGDAVTGLAVGAATAVKFSGALLVPSTSCADS